MLVFVTQVQCLADDGDWKIAHQEALADAGVEHGGFPAWIGPNQQQGVGLFDPGNGRIENITGTRLRIDF